MSAWTFAPNGLRASKARLARHFGRLFGRTLLTIAFLLILSGLIMLYLRSAHALLALGLGLFFLLPALWERGDLDHLRAKPFDQSASLDEILPVELVASWRPDMTAEDFWHELIHAWQALFVMRRLNLPVDPGVLAGKTGPLNYDALWEAASTIARGQSDAILTPAYIVAGIFSVSPGLSQMLTAAKVSQDDMNEVAGWLGRLESYEHQERPIYGGVARDWAAGFTPLLARYGQNLSHQIEQAGQQFSMQERTSQLDSLITALSNGNNSVVLVGETGIGKTALLYGLADRVLRGEAAGRLAHHQVIALNASVLLSGTTQPGDLERIILSVLGEAVHAGNIIIALDEAQLFFGQGTGAINLSQILLPILQGRSMELVLTLTPGEWQRIKSTNSALASLVTPLVLTEPNETEVMRLLADRALILEHGRFITTYQALKETYRLSGRYYQEEAYPGRALNLLEAALSQPEGNVVTPVSVQRAVEGQLGVKVEQATQQEADELLNLEAKIHERMINQSRAVSVVSAALRRARAGVANPNRPVGTFLFLGPTGVGKTELAKSLAALYFGAESNVIRLDMSEYQQPQDAERLLVSSGENPAGFLAQIRTKPFAVVLLDEIEKAHPNVLNLLLQLLDEGKLTDSASKPASFKDAIVIATSNAGADEIRKHIEAGEELESFEQSFTDNLISSGAFKPELLNRFDEIVLFRPLNEGELAQVVTLLVAEVNRTLANQKITVTLSPEATTLLVREGYDPRLGARPMRRMVTRRVEDAVAARILKGLAHAGDTIALGIDDVNIPKSNNGQTQTEA